MAKKLNATQLGLPDGFRLTQSSRSNIVKIAIIDTFKKEMLKLGYDECQLAACITEVMYTVQEMTVYKYAIRAMNKNDRDGKNPVPDYMRWNNVVRVSTGKAKLIIGDDSPYPYRGNQDEEYGIVGNDWFKTMLSHLTPAEAKSEGIDSSLVGNKDSSNDYIWTKRYFVSRSPSNAEAAVNTYSVWEDLPDYTKKHLLRHIKRCKKLTDDIEKTKELIGRVLASNNSAISLCNEAPEFISWIRLAAGLNKDGRRCTDVTAMDDLQQLRSVIK